MRTFLHFALGFVFASVLFTVAAISMWQFWVILLMWIFAGPIDGLINLITE